MDINLIYNYYFAMMAVMMMSFMLMRMMDPVARLGAVIGTEDKS